ncbi:MAG: COX15/CtaA family protein [Flavobacteriaceae bacterium]|nr:COX15/CtaA family protein [Flavobacteriaceae bacterium]MBT6653961.1 COX15/CtaA family protein [Flavobacteriaceae bacterium]
MLNNFIKISKISLVLVYLVILAGSLVRMTGSGMGCPDWPKCFGYYIPPSEESDLIFKSNHDYKSNQMIILNNEKLYTAKSDFRSSNEINLNNWILYEKHNYVTYNPVHTWIEFINRLIGAIAGIFTILMLLMSLKYWKENKNITLISLLVVLGMGFQAWLGKLVVDSNLAPYKITVHMLMALVIVGLIIYLIYTLNERENIVSDKKIKYLIIVSITLTLIQVITGTQVREFIDIQYELSKNKDLWLESPDFYFYFHRTFSLLVFFINAFLYYYAFKKSYNLKIISLISLVIFLEILLGIIMYYGDFPIFSQPLHLFLATILFGYQFYWSLFFIKNTNDLQIKNNS